MDDQKKRQYTDLFIIPVQNCILNHMRMYHQCAKEKTAAIASNIRVMMEKSTAMIASGLSAIASIKAIDPHDLMHSIAVSPICNVKVHSSPETDVFFGKNVDYDTCDDYCRSTRIFKERALDSFARHKTEAQKRVKIQCCHEHHFMVESMNELVIIESMRYRPADEALPVYLYVLGNRCHINKN